MAKVYNFHGALLGVKGDEIIVDLTSKLERKGELYSTCTFFLK